MKVQLQFINGIFYPSDCVSRKNLLMHWGIENLSLARFKYLLPVLVKKGFKFAIHNYEFPKYDYYVPQSSKIGGIAKSVKNPCANCRLKDLCDDGECGMKSYKLFSGK